MEIISLKKKEIRRKRRRERENWHPRQRDYLFVSVRDVDCFFLSRYLLEYITFRNFFFFWNFFNTGLEKTYAETHSLTCSLSLFKFSISCELEPFWHSSWRRHSTVFLGISTERIREGEREWRRASVYRLMGWAHVWHPIVTWSAIYRNFSLLNEIYIEAHIFVRAFQMAPHFLLFALLYSGCALRLSRQMHTLFDAFAH